MKFAFSRLFGAVGGFRYPKDGQRWVSLAMISKPMRASQNHKLDLNTKLMTDIGSAIASSSLVAPAITIIDQAIFSNASGKEALFASLQRNTLNFLMNPGQFLKSPQYLWILGVYSGTYIFANCSETWAKHKKMDHVATKFAASSAANVSLSLLKDRDFTRRFGVLAPRPVPITSLGLYCTRDTLTVLSSFVLPKFASQWLVSNGFSKAASDTTAQLLVPCMIQTVSVPMHLLGMDYYNYSSKSASHRLEFIKKEYLKTLGARVGRIFPAFGIGGVTNNWIRSHFPFSV